MNIAIIAIMPGIKFILSEFIAWQQRKARDAGYVPSAKDVDDFLAEVQQDTPEKIEAEARQEMGLPPVP